MRLFSSEHSFDHTWENVSAANWKKYPNEMTPHVIHVDYLGRNYDSLTGVLHTERLLTCKQSVPELFVRLFGMEPVVYFYEQSQCHSKQKILALNTKNLTGSNLIVVEETCI